MGKGTPLARAAVGPGLPRHTAFAWQPLPLPLPLLWSRLCSALHPSQPQETSFWGAPEKQWVHGESSVLLPCWDVLVSGDRDAPCQDGSWPVLREFWMEATGERQAGLARGRHGWPRESALPPGASPAKGANPHQPGAVTSFGRLWAVLVKHLTDVTDVTDPCPRGAPRRELRSASSSSTRTGGSGAGHRPAPTPGECRADLNPGAEATGCCKRDPGVTLLTVFAQAAFPALRTGGPPLHHPRRSTAVGGSCKPVCLGW